MIAKMDVKKHQLESEENNISQTLFHVIQRGNKSVIFPAFLIVIPWARVVCLMYTPEAWGLQAQGLRVYISGEQWLPMV